MVICFAYWSSMLGHTSRNIVVYSYYTVTTAGSFCKICKVPFPIIFVPFS